MSKQIEVIKFAAFYNEGARGLSGGAAKNDKVWLLARVNGVLMSFWGRRNGTLKSKVWGSMFEAMSKFEEKTGTRKSGDIYTAMAPTSPMVKSLCPNLIADISAAA